MPKYQLRGSREQTPWLESWFRCSPAENCYEIEILSARLQLHNQVEINVGLGINTLDTVERRVEMSTPSSSGRGLGRLNVFLFNHLPRSRAQIWIWQIFCLIGLKGAVV